MRPVMTGLWHQRETWDGTYNGDDLLDAHELLDLRDENERRWREWRELNNHES